MKFTATAMNGHGQTVKFAAAAINGHGKNREEFTAAAMNGHGQTVKFTATAINRGQSSLLAALPCSGHDRPPEARSFEARSPAPPAVKAVTSPHSKPVATPLCQ